MLNASQQRSRRRFMGVASMTTTEGCKNTLGGPHYAAYVLGVTLERRTFPRNNC